MHAFCLSHRVWRRESGGVIESSALVVNAIDGDVGRKNNPLTVRTDLIDASGVNVYIENLKDTTIGNITAEEELVLDYEIVIGGRTYTVYALLDELTACEKETPKENHGGGGRGHGPPASHCHKRITHKRQAPPHTKLA